MSDADLAIGKGVEQTAERIAQKFGSQAFGESFPDACPGITAITSPPLGPPPPPPASEIRLKRDITKVGEVENGIGLYRFRYIWSDTTYVGVLAQEVAAVKPEAVQRGDDGYLRVDYAQLGLRLQTWDEWVAGQ
jgi:hypothetical protein